MALFIDWVLDSVRLFIGWVLEVGFLSMLSLKTKTGPRYINGNEGESNDNDDVKCRSSMFRVK